MKKINVKGVIVNSDDKWIYDWFGVESTSPKEISAFLADCKNGEDIEVEINSPGGHIFAGSEIYSALMEYLGNVVVKITGLAASAASVIAMAGSKIMMSPTAQLMIHNVQSYTSGDYRDMAHMSDVLENTNISIANAYRLKTGLSEKELLALMNKESWFNAQKAKELKFIDEIMFDNQAVLMASMPAVNILSNEIIAKTKLLINENKLLAKKLEFEKLNNLKNRSA